MINWPKLSLGRESSSATCNICIVVGIGITPIIIDGLRTRICLNKSYVEFYHEILTNIGVIIFILLCNYIVNWQLQAV